MLCGFTRADEFDAAVLDAMSCGYIHGSDIRKFAAELDAIDDRARLRKIFRDSWALFYERLDVTAEALAESFVQAVTTAARVVSPLDIIEPA
jgi:hypothetical protein